MRRRDCTTGVRGLRPRLGLARRSWCGTLTRFRLLPWDRCREGGRPARLLAGGPSTSRGTSCTKLIGHLAFSLWQWCVRQQ